MLSMLHTPPCHAEGFLAEGHVVIGINDDIEHPVGWLDVRVLVQVVAPVDADPLGVSEGAFGDAGGGAVVVFRLGTDGTAEKFRGIPLAFLTMMLGL